MENAESPEAANELVAEAIAKLKAEVRLPQVLVTVGVEGPLTSPEAWERGNVVTVEVLEVRSMPAVWAEGIDAIGTTGTRHAPSPPCYGH